MPIISLIGEADPGNKSYMYIIFLIKANIYTKLIEKKQYNRKCINYEKTKLFIPI